MRITETHVGGAAGVITGAVIWALTTYVFKGNTPDPIQALVWLAVPGIVGAVGGYLTRKADKQPAPDTGPANQR